MLCFFIRYCKESSVKKTVAAFSVITLIVGAVLIGFAFILKQNAFMKIETDDFNFPGAMFMVLVIFGFLAVITGIIGVFLAWKPKIPLICVFAILSFSVAMAYIGVGAGLLVFNSQGKAYMDSYCNGDDVNPKNPLKEILENMDEMTDLINENMCTAKCPCPSSAAKYYKELNDGIERQWNSEEPMYETFKECYAKLKKDGEEANIEVTEINASILRLYENIEQDFACAGLCTKPKFYYSVDVNSGGPQVTCLGAVQSEIDNSALLVGAFTLIFGLVIFLAC